MVLTTAQLQALKADIVADSTLNAIPKNSDGCQLVADAYNLAAAVDHWVWRTSVGETDYTRNSGIDTDGTTVTTWSWTTYIGRSQGERDAWPRLFMGGGTGCNPSLVNVRSAFTDIFSGAGGATQRAHLLAISRRKATRAEKLFAAGSGTAASPSVMAAEGVMTSTNVFAAMAS